MKNSRMEKLFNVLNSSKTAKLIYYVRKVYYVEQDFFSKAITF